MHSSSVQTLQDQCGEYEVELFDAQSPKRIIVCAHGNGVRRWDGERFFYAVAEHFADSVVVLVDQNQPKGDGVHINPLPVLVARLNEARKQAEQLHSEVPVVIIGHSMGCGVASLAETTGLSAMVFITPAAGKPQQSLIERYGPDIVHGKRVTTSDGLIKIITAEYYNSLQGIIWEVAYAKLMQHFSPVYAFEAGDDEIIGKERHAHRQLPFTSYQIIPQARHNFVGQPLADLLASLDKIPQLTP